MLDLKELRRDPESARAALERRRAADRLDEVLQLDARRRELLPQEEALRAEQNAASKAIGEAKQGGGDERESSRSAISATCTASSSPKSGPTSTLVKKSPARPDRRAARA